MPENGILSSTFGQIRYTYVDTCIYIYRHYDICICKYIKIYFNCSSYIYMIYISKLFIACIYQTSCFDGFSVICIIFFQQPPGEGISESFGDHRNFKVGSARFRIITMIIRKCLIGFVFFILVIIKSFAGHKTCRPFSCQDE